jgi:protein TonB
MNLLSLHKDNLDELVFENRNKLYGAYDLRKSYDDHLVKAAMYAVGVFAVVFIIAQLSALFHPSVPKIIQDDPVIFTPVPDIVLVIETPPPPRIPTTRIETRPVENAPIEITTRPIDKPVVQPQPAMIQPVTGTATTGSTSGTGSSIGTQGVATQGAVTPIIPPVEGPTEVADVMPEFPGGMDKLTDFLQNKLQYPQMAYNLHVEGAVLVTFVIGKDGEVTDIAIRKSLGYGCDEEAMRVIEAMPKWTPGKVKGVNVAVRYTLPIRFILR